MEHHCKNRAYGGNSFFVGIHNGGHNQNVGDFTNLGYLDIKGNTGQLNPASVTADFFTKGNQQGQNQKIENCQD